MKEKRKSLRFRASSPFVFSQSDRQGFKGIVKDISMGGLKVAIGKSFDILVGSLVSFCLFLSDRELKLSGRITWILEKNKKKEVGISFFDLPDKSRSQVYDYILRHHKEHLIGGWW